MSLDEIRKDLTDIRYYYSRKEIFDKAESMIGSCAINILDTR